MTPSDSAAKHTIFQEMEQQLVAQGLRIERIDQSRPWGGFFVLNESQAQQFADLYFSGLPVDSLRRAGQLSPKLLVVAPQQRLSWQYHHRRAEIWRVVQGPVGIAVSDTDTEGEVKDYQTGEQVLLAQGERHRLVGLRNWGLVAEIWQHTHAGQPSDEDDIVRVQDDFGR